MLNLGVLQKKTSRERLPNRQHSLKEDSPRTPEENNSVKMGWRKHSLHSGPIAIWWDNYGAWKTKNSSIDSGGGGGGADRQGYFTLVLDQKWWG